MTRQHVRHGFGAVRPYLYGNKDLPALVVEAFGATEIERHDMPMGSHVELQLGDSVLVIEAGRFPADVKPTIASVYVYVPDVDAAVRRALELGATLVSQVDDKHYQERSAALEDSFGNTWYVSTYTGDSAPA